MAKRTTQQQPSEPRRTFLLKPLEQARQLVQTQIEIGEALLVAPIENAERLEHSRNDFYTWQSYVTELLKHIADTDDLADQFQKTVSFGFLGGYDTLSEQIREHRDDIKFYLERLKRIYFNLELFPLKPEPSTNHKGVLNHIDSIELVLQRFHMVARQLKRRHDDRETLIIDDEYDVQDLLHALLKLYFNDVRDEEPSPSLAVGSARLDFLLKVEQTVIEVKKTRKSLKTKDLVDQILVDIGRYEAHPDCKTLIFFIYDPEDFVSNPAALESLSGQRNSLMVRVIVNPKNG